MGWFDEQIKQRKQRDEEVFLDAFLHIAGAVTGERISLDASDRMKLAQAAMGEILRFYHVKSREVPENLSTLEEQLEYLIKPHGIMRRRVNLKGEWYRDSIGALLGMRKDDGTAVALIPDGVSGYKFYDISSGKYLKLNRKTAALLEEKAICFYKPFPMKSLNLRDLLIYIAGTLESSDIVFALMTTLAVTLTGMFLPKLNRILFSDLIKSESMELFWATVFFMGCVSVSSLLFSSAKELVVERVTMKMDLFVQAATVMRIISLPADFFKRYAAGELAAYVQYIENLCNMIVSTVFSLGLSALFALLYLSQIYVYTPSLFKYVFFILTAVAMNTLISSILQMKVSKREMEFAASEGGMSYALISGIQKIKLAGAEKRAFARWGRLYAKGAEFYYNPPLFLKVNPAINLAITSLGTILIYDRAIGAGVGIEDYYAFHTAYAMMMGVILSLHSSVLMIARVRPVMEMARPILETKPEVSEEKEVISRISGTIELNNVSFRYREMLPNILDNFSLKIPSGQYLAIVGESGCGKSTLMRLLLGFERPQKGAIYYDGKDMNSIDLSSLRKKIGVVLQNAKLFQGDIKSNIRISAPDISLEEVWEAAELAGIAEDIRKMPMGMETLLSEGSGGISGGQRQRLVIARAIASKPKIFFFDEATSALDNIAQKRISDSLNRFRCTRIVIAHRLSTIRDCDRIIVLDRGRIVEDGTYDELMKRKGFFSELIERQKIG